jgi:hypothetical protein
MDVYRKNIAAQYEALGRFVEAFEMMVHEARVGCIDMLSYDLPDQKRKLIAIPFHHQQLAALPLFELFRAILIEVIAEPKYQTDYGLTKSDVENFFGILGAISGEYGELLKKRNSLLHGTWFVGYRGSHNPDAESFYVSKYKTSADGLVPVELPSTATELDGLRIRCEDTRNWIAVVHGCLPSTKSATIPDPQFTIEKCFKKKGKTWERIWPPPHRFQAKVSGQAHISSD